MLRKWAETNLYCKSFAASSPMLRPKTPTPTMCLKLFRVSLTILAQRVVTVWQWPLT